MCDSVDSILSNSLTISQKFKEKLRLFYNAINSSDKQTILKEVLQCAEKRDEKLAVEHLLVHLFLHTRLADNLKKTCSRMLLSMDENRIMNTIAIQVQFHINKSRSPYGNSLESNSRVDMTRLGNYKSEKTGDNLIVMMQGLLHNFPPGVEALSSVIDDVFLYTFDEFLHDVQSIDARNVCLEVAQQRLHNSTKFLDAILRLCHASVHLPSKSLTLLAESYKVIRHDKIAFNTKAHCGALLVMAVMQFPDHLAEDDTEKLSNALNFPEIKVDDSMLTAMLLSCLDDISQICIYSGIVNTYPLHVMTQHIVNNTRLAIYIFQNMLNLAKKRSNVAAEILEISRTLVALSPLLITFRYDSLVDTMKACWDYIWMHLDHFVDAVRNDAQKLLKTFIQITLDSTIVDETNPHIEMFTSAISEIINGNNPNFKALSHIASALKCQILLKIFPDLPRRLINMLSNSSVAQDVCAAYERLMEQHHRENSFTWSHLWVQPLIPFQQSEDAIPFILRIYHSAFKLDPHIINFLPKVTAFSEHELRAYLGCIILARKNDLKIDHLLKLQNDNLWNGISTFNKSQIEILLCHKSAEIRILVLTLIVECQKSTELYTAEDFERITSFFRYNSSSHLPHFRQNMTALFKKALNRYKESYYVIQRSIRNEEARPKDAQKRDKLEGLRKQDRVYRHFIDTFFHHHLIRGLCHQCEHGKRYICLNLMLYMKTCLTEEHFNAQWMHPEYIQMLYAAFTDTYENNLIMICKLLMEIKPEFAFPKTCMREFSAAFKRCVYNIAYEVKANIVASSTYELLVLLHSPAIKALLQNNLAVDLSLIQPEVQSNAVFLVYREFAAQIDVQLAIAECDVQIAAKYAPINGLFFSVRHLIHKEQLDTLYPHCLPGLVKQCLNVVNVALPIVNSNAPEGYHPNSASYAKSEVTPQLVLSYAWRAIKEVSLLFGELQINDPKVKEILNNNPYILESISRFFIGLFEEAKHRGAYEQGYIGFSKFVEKLWNSGCEWAKLPEQWLHNTLQLISSRDAKICATRRSAGIPFMIQAILINESKHRGNKSFHHSMRFLLDVARDFSDANQKCTVHAMNTLRALFRHNQLGEIVAGYVSEGMFIAIQQFSHSDWAIRNSATLMFSALTMRIFGVQRLKDTKKLSSKNRLSLKIFTTRYPTLYEFLFSKLHEFDGKPKGNVSLYPVLLILERLYLTFDAKKDQVKMMEHVQSILKASSRPIFKIRELSIQASIPFQKFLSSEIINFPTTDNNQIHALLLHLKGLIVLENKFSFCYFKRFFFVITEAGKTISHTNATLLMDILIDLLKTSAFKEDEHELYKQLLACLHQQQYSTISTCNRFQQTKMALYLHVILKIPRPPCYKRTFIVSALLQALTSCNEDMNIFALNCIRYISSDKVDNSKGSELEYDFVQTLDSKIKNLLSHLIRVHLIKRRVFTDLFAVFRNRSQLYVLKVCQILYNYPSIIYTIRPLAIPVKLSHQIILDYLSLQATSINSELFVAVMSLISKFVAGSNEILNLDNIITQMDDWGSGETTVEERLAIADFLLNNCNLLFHSVLMGKSKARLWTIYINLMQDDEFRVRNFVGQISHRILTDTDVSLTKNVLKDCPLMPERLHEEVLARLPIFLGHEEAIKRYLDLCLQCEDLEVYSDPMDATVFDKLNANNFKASRPFAICARTNMALTLWHLDHDLTYESRIVFLKEHYLLVITKLLSFISQQEATPDRLLCLRILGKFAKKLEDVGVGTLEMKQINAYYTRVLRSAVREERASCENMTSCIVEVSEFLSCVLFTSRKD